MGKRIRTTLLAGAAAALIAVPVAPAVASDEGPCQFLMPIAPGDVVECVRYILISAIDWPPR